MNSIINAKVRHMFKLEKDSKLYNNLWALGLILISFSLLLIYSYVIPPRKYKYNYITIGTLESVSRRVDNFDYFVKGKQYSLCSGVSYTRQYGEKYIVLCDTNDPDEGEVYDMIPVFLETEAFAFTSGTYKRYFYGSNRFKEINYEYQVNGRSYENWQNMYINDTTNFSSDSIYKVVYSLENPKRSILITPLLAKDSLWLAKQGLAKYYRLDYNNIYNK